MAAQSEETSKILDMKRENHTLLGVWEKKVLLFLASRLPAWMTPNILTTIGMAGSLLVFFGYWFSTYNENFLWMACLGWIINWYGDSLDGSLARYRNIEKPRFGFYIDHHCDTLSVWIIGMGFGLSPYVRFDVALLLLIAYLLMSIQTYILTCSTGIFRISYAKLGATEFRLIAILITIFIYFVKLPQITLLNNIWSVLDVLILIPFGIMVLLFIVTVCRNAVRLYRADNHQH
ncbi:CDP-alcohol phosphatidyltransferase family protein [bacterium]|nr:CDP-alcohol phosphatidyltransferase family protein [bacterium]